MVLDYLSGVPDNEQLNLQQLSQKLMALTNADRCSDLAALDLSYRAHLERFTIPGLTKTRRSGSLLQAIYPAFRENPRLCPVQTLQAYEQKTHDLRPNRSSRNPLFISVRKPVKPATLGRWLKGVMRRPSRLGRPPPRRPEWWVCPWRTSSERLTGALHPHSPSSTTDRWC